MTKLDTYRSKAPQVTLSYRYGDERGVLRDECYLHESVLMSRGVADLNKVPGPGAYTPGFEVTKKKSPVVSMGIRHSPYSVNFFD